MSGNGMRSTLAGSAASPEAEKVAATRIAAMRADAMRPVSRQSAAVAKYSLNRMGFPGSVAAGGCDAEHAILPANAAAMQGQGEGRSFARGVWRRRTPSERSNAQFTGTARPTRRLGAATAHRPLPPLRGAGVNGCSWAISAAKVIGRICPEAQVRMSAIGQSANIAFRPIADARPLQNWSFRSRRDRTFVRCAPFAPCLAPTTAQTSPRELQFGTVYSTGKRTHLLGIEFSAFQEFSMLTSAKRRRSRVHRN